MNTEDNKTHTALSFKQFVCVSCVLYKGKFPSSLSHSLSPKTKEKVMLNMS